jgi:hypothetical protein
MRDQPLTSRLPILTRVSSPQVQRGFLSLGHAAARLAVTRAAEGGRLQRTILVHGAAGAGKSAFVDDLLALLLCADGDPSARPCNACRACRDARSRSHPDLVLGSPERWREARATGDSIVGAARRWLLDSAGTPIAGERRVLLIEGVDRATEQTQNALLKALEEPSERQMFILVADDLGRVLPTIISRSQPLRIGTVSRHELVEWLMDREGLPGDQAQALARLADGLAGRAIGYARQPDRVEWRRRVQTELLALLERGVADRFGSVRDLLEQPVAGDGGEPQDVVDDNAARVSTAAQRVVALAVLDAWQGLARDLLVSRAGLPELAPSAQLLGGLEDAARPLPIHALTRFLGLSRQVGEALMQNAAPRLALETAMLAWPATPRSGAPAAASAR